jgi:hypothetical protein
MFIRITFYILYVIDEGAIEGADEGAIDFI